MGGVPLVLFHLQVPYQRSGERVRQRARNHWAQQLTVPIPRVPASLHHTTVAAHYPNAFTTFHRLSLGLVVLQTR